LVLAANQVPRFDVDPSCRAAATAAIGVSRSEAVCQQDERTARGKLEREWGQFAPKERTRCMTLSSLGDFASYVELLTCLEMAQSAGNPTGDDQPAGNRKP
jgi:hypothetical protein